MSAARLLALTMTMILNPLFNFFSQKSPKGLVPPATLYLPISEPCALAKSCKPSAQPSWARRV